MTKGINMFKLGIIEDERPQDMNSAKAIVDFLYPKACDVLMNNGEVGPMLFLVRRDCVAYIAVSQFFENDSTKDFFREFIIGICKEWELEGLGLVTEGWAVKAERFDAVEGPISEHKERVEILVVYGEWSDESTEDVLVEFSRDKDNRPVLGEKVYSQPLGGRLRQFFNAMDKVVH